jgi:hypothetical protein
VTPSSAEPPLHLHIGLGKLGLGFVVPFFKDSSFQFLGAVKTDTKEPRPHHDVHDVIARGGALLLAMDGGRRLPAPTPHLLPYDPKRTKRTLIDALPQPPQVVSCSVGVAKLPAIYKILYSLIVKHRAHYRKHPLVFLPFENKADAGTVAAEQILARGLPPTVVSDCLAPANVVVDRICSRIEVIPEPDPGVCIVHTESYQHCCLTFPGGTNERVEPILRALGIANHYVDEKQFDEEVRRKYWCVNALQYAVTVIAIKNGLNFSNRINDAIQLDEVQDRIASLREELAIAMYTYLQERGHRPSFRNIEQQLRHTWERIGKSRQDKLDRIAEGLEFVMEDLPMFLRHHAPLGKIASFGDFFTKWRERILDPSEVLLDNAGRFRRPLYLPKLNHYLLRLLANALTTLSPASPRP